MQDRIKKKKRALSEASQKTRTKFSKIVETAADLPLAPKNKQKIGAIHAAAKRKKAQPETLPTSVTPMAEASSASADQASLLSSPGLVMPGNDMLSAFYSLMMTEGLIETNLTFDAPFSSNPTGVSDDHPSSLTTSATATIIIDPVISNPMAPAIALDTAPSATSSVSAAILPPASPSLPTAPLGTSLSLNPADVSDDSASHKADQSEQTLAQIKTKKGLARNEAHRKARTEERWNTFNSFKLFNIYTGKPAPEGASPSEQYITFNAYVKRHVPCNKTTRTAYVNCKTGVPADGVTEETHQRGQDTTLYTWLVQQKMKEFSKILKEGGDLPLPPLSSRNNQQKTQAADKRNEAHRKARAEGRGKKSKLFNIYTGKPAPEEASPSEQYISFYNYVRRHVPHNKINLTTYVNGKTGELAEGITEETHQREQHTTRYSWLLRQKNMEFSKIVAEGGALPPALSKQKHKRQKAQAAFEQNTHRAPARSNVVRPRAEAASASAGRHSSLTASGHAAEKIVETGKPLPLPDGLTAADLALNRSFLTPATPSTSADTTPSAVTSVSTPILPPASHSLTSPLDMSLNSNPDEAFDASAHSILSPMISSTDQASPLPSLELEEFVDEMLLVESLFAAESDTAVLASLTESDLTAKTATTTGEPLPLLSENPIQQPVERDLDLYFSEPATTRPAFSPLPTTPLYADSAEAADAVTPPGLDPEISAEQDSFKQDTRQKRKPNVHFFFQPKENDRVGPASRKAKTMPSDGSVEHPLPEADTSDSISEALFIPSPSAKRPTF